MWRSILVVLLLCSLLRAQQETFAAQQIPSSTNTFQPSYKTFTQQETLRRGTTEKAAVFFTLGDDGFVSLVSPRNRGGNIVPLKLEFDSSEGIAVSDFTFPSDTKPHITPPKEHIRLLWPNVTVHFKVTASPETALGEHVLKGKLKYQLVGTNGVLPPLETEVTLPLMVVEHDAVAKDSLVYKQNFARENSVAPLWVWFSLPILVPLVLVMAVVCGIRGEDCSC